MRRELDEAVQDDLDAATARDSWVVFTELEADNIAQLVDAGCTRGEALIVLMLNEIKTVILDTAS